MIKHNSRFKDSLSAAVVLSILVSSKMQIVWWFWLLYYAHGTKNYLMTDVHLHTCTHKKKLKISLIQIAIVDMLDATINVQTLVHSKI